MKKLYKLGIGGGVTVVILAIIAVVLVVVLTNKKDTTEPQVMYFAMHLGDPDRLSQMSSELRRRYEAECSLKINVDNTRESIKGLRHKDQKYKFITYTDVVNTTSAMTSDEALKHLDTIGRDSSLSKYVQENVAKAFVDSKRSDDLLVYYIPCNFDYKAGDDLQKFVKVLEHVPGKALLISNTKSSEEVSRVYQHKKEYTVGFGDSVIEQIIVFGGGNGTITTSLPVTIETTRTKRTPTTVETPSTTRPLKTSKTTSKTRSPTTSEAARRTTSTPVTKTTKSTRTTKKERKSTTVSTTPDPTAEKLNCLFVADLYNYADNSEAYEMEADLLSAVGYDVFDESPIPANVALWAYGHTSFPKVVNASLEKMSQDYDGLEKQLKKLSYVSTSDPFSTRRAINAINEMDDTDERLNCLLFLTAQTKTRGLPKLKPKNKNIEKIVVVGLNSTLPKSVVPSDGTLISIPYYYVESHIVKVVEAILGIDKSTTTIVTTTSPSRSTKPSKRPTSKRPAKTTTKPVTTTQEPPEEFKCLFVADLYNYADNSEAYGMEAEFLSSVGYDVFNESRISMNVALWAYGYTSFSKVVNSSLEKMSLDYESLKEQLRELNYVSTVGPLSTKRAIEAINEMDDTDERLNCLLFFTAQIDTMSLPKLDPKNKNIKNIVVVGLNSTIPLEILPASGTLVSIPYYYVESHIVRVVDALIGRDNSTTTMMTTTSPSRSTKPSKRPTSKRPAKTTTKRVTTTKVPTQNISCLFVGDLYNFGKDVEKYLDEADFISNIGYDFFKLKAAVTAAGLWAYGYTTFPASPDLSNFTGAYEEFMNRLEEMQYADIASPMSTSAAINVINNLKSTGTDCHCGAGARCHCNSQRINCLVFFSAQKDTEKLPALDPKDQGITRVVAVGFDNTDLSKIVEGRGQAVSVPYYWKGSHIDKVIRAILGRPEPTPKPTMSTSSTTKRRTTTKQAATTTVRSSSRGQTTTKPASSITPKPLERIKCLFVGDLFNFGKDADKYINEAEFMHSIGYDFFELNNTESTAGLWAYGYTTFPASPDLINYTKVYDEFVSRLEMMQYTDVASPMSTSAAINVINNLKSVGADCHCNAGTDCQCNAEITNCIVFFSAQKDTEKLPALDPKDKEVTRIVAVGFDDTDLSTIVDERGQAVSVPYYWTESDVVNVIKAITGSSEPTTSTSYSTTKRRTTTKRAATTTVRSSTRGQTTTKPASSITPKQLERIKCLFVGDLFNFGKDADKYINEAEFMHSIGYDFFELNNTESTAGLWAYGYTTFPASPDLINYTKVYDEFVSRLEMMQYTDVASPMSTSAAINVINNLKSVGADCHCNAGTDCQCNAEITNCIVFFSAQKDTEKLPALDPKDKEVTRIVAVGFDDTDLSTIVDERGQAVSVPYYWTESDVVNVIKAITGSSEPTTSTSYSTTKRRTTTKRAATTTVRSSTRGQTTTKPASSITPRILKTLKCLFVADLYNFGKDEEKYFAEAELIDSIGYDFFEIKDTVATAALWAYGYANFTASPDLNKFSENYDKFEEYMENLQLTETSSPITTSKAIETINNLPDGDDRVNCLVFFSAQKDTKSLPALDPRNRKIKRIVAVGYDGSDLSEVVGTRGVAVSVPHYYTERDVLNVIKAIQGRYKP